MNTLFLESYGHAGFLVQMSPLFFPLNSPVKISHHGKSHVELEYRLIQEIKISKIYTFIYN